MTKLIKIQRLPAYICLFLLTLLSSDAFATTYYVSSSIGSDTNNGLNEWSPYKSIDKINSMSFAQGDSILFKSGDYWEGMFWIKGSGTVELPIVVDRYGGLEQPVINGYGFQSCLLIYNDEHIQINNLELFNEASHLDLNGNIKRLEGFNGLSNLWGSGQNVRFGVKIVADSQSLQNFKLSNLYIHNIYPTPTNEANIYKGYGIKLETLSTTPNNIESGSCSLFNSIPNDNWPRALTITTPDSLDSGSEQIIQINVTSLPIEGASYRIVKTMANGNWYNGPEVSFSTGLNLISVSPVTFDRTVRLQVSSGEIGFDALILNGAQYFCDEDEGAGEVRLISNVTIEDCEIQETGHYGIWIKSLGLNGIDSYKNSHITVRNCHFLHTGGSGFVPNKSEDILVEGCSFNHTGSSIDARMWRRGSGMWVFDCKDVISQHNYFMNAHGPQDSYGCHIDYGNENVVYQYNFSYNNEGGFAEILGDNINCGYRYNISVNDGYREDPNNEPWNKKGKIFWVSNYCGSNTIRCPSSGTFIYNNTVFVNDTLNPEIYFWPNIGDVHVFNNLIYAAPEGDIIPTLIQNTSNILEISHNLFFDAARMDLDSDLTNNALFENPLLLNANQQGGEDPMFYKTFASSIAIGNGKLINGSSEPLDYLYNNGGVDYFGNPLSQFEPPSIGAFNGHAIIFGCTYSNATNYNVNANDDDGSCVFVMNGDCPSDLNNDGAISIGDLLVFLSVFGTVCD